MMQDLIRLLHDGCHSLVIAGGEIRTYDGRGVSDLLRLLHDEPDFLRGAIVADKVVGKAAAALMVVGGVKEVYAEVISRQAFFLLDEAGVSATFRQVVPAIVNREGTGLCPMELLCIKCSSPAECVEAIEKFVNEKMKK